MFWYFESGLHVVDLDGIRMNSHMFSYQLSLVLLVTADSMISTECAQNSEVLMF